MGNQFSNGIGGALSLALIAFSTVFMVLGGLTLIIFCVRHIAAAVGGINRKKGSSGTGAAPQAPSAAPAPQAQATVPASGDGKRLAAVISAAILATTGRAVRIKSISPAAKADRRGMTGGWRASALLDNFQGMVKDPWQKRA